MPTWMRQRLPLVLLGLLLLVLVFGQRVAVFVTDWWWFGEVGAQEVFLGVLEIRILLAVVGSLLAGGVIVASLQVARRLRPTVIPRTPQQAAIEQYRTQAEPYLKWLVSGVAALFGISSGVGLAGGWDDFLLWRNGGSFGIDDPTFGLDVGYFVFDLPWWQLVQSWAFTTMILVALLTAGAHLLLGGIRPDAEHDKVLPSVKVHLSVLLMIILALRGWGYWLDRYELNYSPRGTVTGASYTDVNAELPALYLLLGVTVVAIVLVAWGLRSNSFTLPGVAIALLVVGSLLLQGAYPAVIQRLRVDPQELNREREFIEHNLEMTRLAYELNDLGLDDKSAFQVRNDLDQAQIDDNPATFENIRLWDPELLQDNYDQLQALRPFYDFHDVDIDRYEIDGEPRQVMLSARELDPESQIATSQWQNARLTYTHGYGIVASQVNTATEAGQPVFLASDIPPVTNEAVAPDGTLVPEEPGLYYADQGFLDYAISNTEQPELDYEDPENNNAQVFTSYDGQGGVPLGGYGRRLAWALRFSDPNFVLSNLLRDDSRVMLHREVADRVREVAPYLVLDSDPYAAVTNDGVKWIQDAYTITNKFPYSEMQGFDHAGGRSQVNYVRNSVKAVVDAYDGTVTLYVAEPDDPLVQAWRQAFPGLYADLDEAPDDLVAHFRYPEDLFTLQARLYTTYHIPDAAGFYNGADAWTIPADAAAIENDEQGASDQPLEPYYIITTLPGEQEAEFVLIQPYTPVNRPNMVGWLAARSDPEHYGELFPVRFPTNDNVLGPVQAHARIEQEAQIASAITLVDQEGSDLIRGNLLVLPVNQSVLFVEPLFLVNQQAQIPELWQVVLVMGDRVVMRPTLEGALTALVTGGPPVGRDVAEGPTGQGPAPTPDPTPDPSAEPTEPTEPREPIESPEPTPTPSPEPEPSPPPPASPSPTPTPIDPDIDPDATAEELVGEALALFEQADQALADGDLGAYQELTNQARARLERVVELGGLAPASTNGAPGTATASPSPAGGGSATAPASPSPAPSPTGG